MTYLGQEVLLVEARLTVIIAVIAHPLWTALYRARLLRSEEAACQHRMTRFRTAMDAVFPTPPPVSAPALWSMCGEIDL